MLHELQPDIREMLELTQQQAIYHATRAALQNVGQPIPLTDAAAAERSRREQRLLQLRAK